MSKSMYSSPRLDFSEIAQWYEQQDFKYQLLNISLFLLNFGNIKIKITSISWVCIGIYVVIMNWVGISKTFLLNIFTFNSCLEHFSEQLSCRTHDIRWSTICSKGGDVESDPLCCVDLLSIEHHQVIIMVFMQNIGLNKQHNISLQNLSSNTDKW